MTTRTNHNAPALVDTADEGLRDCARGQHCAARTVTVEDGQRAVIPAQTYRRFCEADRGRIRACLEELPTWYEELEERIGDRPRSDGPRVSGGHKAPPPVLNERFEAFLRVLDDVVLSWHERVADRVGLTPITAAHGNEEIIGDACHALAEHVDVLLALSPDAMARSEELDRIESLPGNATGWAYPAAGCVRYFADIGGAGAGIEIFNLHYRALGILGRTPQHEDLITACWMESCQERALRRHDGTAGLADHVECTRCGTQYLGQRLSHLMVMEEQALERKRGRADEGPGGRVLRGSVAGYGGRP